MSQHDAAGSQHTAGAAHIFAATRPPRPPSPRGEMMADDAPTRMQDDASASGRTRCCSFIWPAQRPTPAPAPTRLAERAVPPFPRTRADVPEYQKAVREREDEAARERSRVLAGLVDQPARFWAVAADVIPYTDAETWRRPFSVRCLSCGWRNAGQTEANPNTPRCDVCALPLVRVRDIFTEPRSTYLIQGNAASDAWRSGFAKAGDDAGLLPELVALMLEYLVWRPPARGQWADVYDRYIPNEWYVARVMDEGTDAPVDVMKKGFIQVRFLHWSTGFDEWRQVKSSGTSGFRSRRNMDDEGRIVEHIGVEGFGTHTLKHACRSFWDADPDRPLGARCPYAPPEPRDERQIAPWVLRHHQSPSWMALLAVADEGHLPCLETITERDCSAFVAELMGEPEDDPAPRAEHNKNNRLEVLWRRRAYAHFVALGGRRLADRAGLVPRLHAPALAPFSARATP
jgi:hypothetical protein